MRKSYIALFAAVALLVIGASIALYFGNATIVNSGDNSDNGGITSVTPIPGTPVEVTSSNPPFKLAMTLNKTVYYSKELIPITITLTNIGDSDAAVRLEAPYDLENGVLTQEQALDIARSQPGVLEICENYTFVRTGTKYYSTRDVEEALELWPGCLPLTEAKPLWEARFEYTPEYPPWEENIPVPPGYGTRHIYRVFMDAKTGEVIKEVDEEGMVDAPFNPPKLPPPTWCWYIVYDESGRVVYNSEHHLWSVLNGLRTLAPGGFIREGLAWSQVGDNNELVRPGIYNIASYVALYSEECEKYFFLETESISISVVEW